MLSLLLAAAHAEQGLWTFDEDPGLVERHDGSDSAFAWTVDEGVLSVTMTREAATQRLYLPLAASYGAPGDTDVFRLRMRFRVTSADLASVLVGFFDADDGNSSTDDHVVVECYDTTYFPGGFVGATYDHGSTSIGLQGWYVYELEADYGSGEATFTLYDDQGEVVASLDTAVGAMDEGVDVVGFGNADNAESTTAETLEVDWLSWSVNDELPSPPPSFDVTALTTTDSLDLAVGTTSWGAAQELELHAALYEDEVADAAHLAWETTATLATELGRSSWEVDLEDLDLPLWSPGDPATHLLRVTVSDAEGELEVLDRVVGFRELVAEGQHLLLNGVPIYLFAHAMVPPGRVPEAIWDDEAFRDAHVQRLLDAGINLVRLDEGPDDWYEAFDRAGILVSAGPYSGTGSSDADGVYTANAAALERTIRTYGSHPSIVMWHLANEVVLTDAMARAMRQLEEDVRGWDPTRLLFLADAVEDSPDIIDDHLYHGWYYYSWHLWEGFGASYAALDRPVMYSETVGAYTGQRVDADGFFTDYDHLLGSALRNVGHPSDWEEASLAYQADLAAYVVESQRRARGPDSAVSGAWPFTHSFSFADDGSVEEKPIVAALAAAHAPLRLSARCLSTHAFAGQTVPGDWHVLNDDLDLLDGLPPSELQLSLVHEDGTVLAEDSVAVDEVAYYDSWSSTRTVEVPEHATAGTAWWVGELVLHGEVVDSTSCELTLGTAESVAASASGSVALYDTTESQATATALGLVGVEATAVDSADELEGHDLLVIGADSFDGELEALLDGIDAFRAEGGRVLVLEQHEVNAFNALGWPDAAVTLDGSFAAQPYWPEDFVNLERTASEQLRAGLTHEDFRLWNLLSWESGFPRRQPALLPYAIRDPDSYGRLEVLANAGAHLGLVVLAELWSDDETAPVLLSQLEVVSRAATDPVAARVLANLIDHGLESEVRHGAERGCDDELELGAYHFDDEAGAVTAPMAQGWIVSGRVAADGLGAEQLGRACRGPQQDDGSGWLTPQQSTGLVTCPMWLRADFPVGPELWVEVQNTDDEALAFGLAVGDERAEPTSVTVEPGATTREVFTLSEAVPAGERIELAVEAELGSFHDGGSPGYTGLVFGAIGLGDASSVEACVEPEEPEDTGTHDSDAPPTDTGGDTGEGSTITPPAEEVAAGCGCGAGGTGFALLPLVLLAQRRRRAAARSSTASPPLR